MVSLSLGLGLGPGLCLILDFATWLRSDLYLDLGLILRLVLVLGLFPHLGLILNPDKINL